MVTMIFTCDIWKSTNSMRLIGVYTNRRKLAKDIRKLLRDKTIKLNDGYEMPTDFEDLKSLNNTLNYLYAQKEELNKLF